MGIWEFDKMSRDISGKRYAVLFWRFLIFGVQRRVSEIRRADPQWDGTGPDGRGAVFPTTGRPARQPRHHSMMPPRGGRRPLRRAGRNAGARARHRTDAKPFARLYGPIPRSIITRQPRRRA